MSLLTYIAAFSLDLLIGDPPDWPHPIRWIGSVISRGEKQIRRWCNSRFSLYVSGGVLWLVIVGMTWVITWAAITSAFHIHWALGMAVQLWLATTVLATRCLKDCADAVLAPLRAGDISEARKQLSYIVGRDTSELDEQQITRATVETVAENTVDGVIAPLLYLFLGGVPLAMAYKAVNTLDSMVGYNNERYREVGYVSAKLDDLANYIPARLSLPLFALAALLSGKNSRSALIIGWRDRYQHKSPNSAWSEASIAGALGIRLGGPNQYFGERVEKPWIGDAIREIEPQDICFSTRLMYVSSTCALVIFVLGYVVTL
ncbi:cobalamin biosynthesis protein CobD [Vibrio albus]|uniref:Cobalamin biosynthesis protein CobD n=2 Tax=Vibrio albus TaxID=2200953 RepID=A0A2U3B6L1_9VIBR|nr:cobalamin biosynthesis protein CobD [Vibrio albus]